MNERLKNLKHIFLFFLIILILRGVQLQILQGEYYYQLSEGNRISISPINAPRGRIIDKHGNILVSNKLSYDLYLFPNEISEEMTIDELLTKLSQLTNLELKVLQENYQKNSANSAAPIILMRHLTQEQMIIITENRANLPGVSVKESSMRDYVYKELASHLIGYVNRDMQGITGLERQYEEYLHGEAGFEQFEVNTHNQRIKSLGISPPQVGNDLILSLDKNLQHDMESLLAVSFLSPEQQKKVISGTEDLNEVFASRLQTIRETPKQELEQGTPTGAAAIAMDINSGAILAMASQPNYDLDLFARGFANQEYEVMINDPLKPFINRAIMTAVPPGSIFKLVTAAAAIENLDVTVDSTFIDENAKFYIPNWSTPFKNWTTRPEGELNLTKALARSNNIVFYQLAYDLFLEYQGEILPLVAKKFGLGERTGIDLPGEVRGLVPTRDWKRDNLNERWFPGDSVNLSIGQWALKTTPIQLISMLAAIANDGYLYKPYIVEKVVDADGEIVLENKSEKVKLPFRDETYQIIQQGMIETTTARYSDGREGTAASVFRDFPVQVAGKTGTAQTGISGHNHGWFVGYAPYDNPEIAVLVFLEHGHSSANTLPIAAGIFKSYFNLEEEKIEEIAVAKEVNIFLDFLKSIFSSKD